MENTNPKEQTIQKFVADHQNGIDVEKTIIIREGEAPKQLDAIKPNKVHLSGTISAPSEFYNKRKTLHNKDKCHVVYNKNTGTIALIVDENFENDNYKVVGKIIDNPDLDPFFINKNHLFGVKELMEHLKFSRLYFKDKDENAKIVTNLKSFKAKVEKTFEDIDDQRGNSTKIKIDALESGLAESFDLSMPIHKGGESYTFKVEILCKGTDGGVLVWLESRELKELQQKSVDKIMGDQLKHFSEIVCIEQ